MGVERSITRWYAQRQLLLSEVAQLEEKIASSLLHDEAIEPQRSLLNVPGLVEEEQRLAIVKQKLRTLGECPRPMMG